MGIPLRFRKWSAISAVSGALERKCWTTTFDALYPNTYILLVGKPGAGKTLPIKMVHSLWRSIDGLNTAPRTVTRAALVDHMMASPSYYEWEGKSRMYHSILVAASEFGNFFQEYSHEFVNMLNELYDCETVFEERTRYKGLLAVTRPHLCILGGTQPDYLSMILPDRAFGLGLMSRLVLIYSGADPEPRILWEHDRTISKAQLALKELYPGLLNISTLVGRFRWESEAKDKVSKWVRDGAEPRPTHPKLEHYCTRRTVHVLKLSMIMAASNNRELVVTAADVQEAMDSLFEAEEMMPDILISISARGGNTVLSDLVDYLQEMVERRGQPLPEPRLYDFLQTRVPAHSIKSVIDAATVAGLIKIHQTKLVTKHRLFWPGDHTADDVKREEPWRRPNLYEEDAQAKKRG